MLLTRVLAFNCAVLIYALPVAPSTAPSTTHDSLSHVDARPPVSVPSNPLEAMGDAGSGDAISRAANDTSQSTLFGDTPDEDQISDAIQKALVQRYEQWVNVAKSSGIPTLEEEAKELEKFDYADSIKAGLKQAADAGILKALTCQGSCDTAKIAESVLAIAAAMTAAIPAVGPLVSIGLTFVSSLIELFMGKSQEQSLPPPLTTDDIKQAMTEVMETHDVKELQTLLVPDAMGTVSGRVQYWKDTFLDNDNFDWRSAKDFIDTLNRELQTGMCSSVHGSPRGTIDTLMRTITINIQGIPWAFKSKVLDGPKTKIIDPAHLMPTCTNDPNHESFGWDNHDAVKEEMADFHDWLVTLTQEISLFDAAMTQYITLFSVVQQIFEKWGDKCVDDSWICSNTLKSHWKQTREEIDKTCQLSDMMEASIAFHHVLAPDLAQNNIGSINQLVDVVQKFVDDSNQPAFVFSEYVGSNSDCPQNHGCTCCATFCDKMIGMQQQFLSRMTWSLNDDGNLCKDNHGWTKGDVALLQLGKPVPDPGDGAKPDRYPDAEVFYVGAYYGTDQWCGVGWNAKAEWYPRPTIHLPNSCFATFQISMFNPPSPPPPPPGATLALPLAQAA